MPVTAKLSRRFYDAFGDDIANELVEWFNQVDATYRADLRELNELNFARFDAKLEQRLAESDVKWEQRFAELDVKWEQRLAELETKLIDAFNEAIACKSVNWKLNDFAFRQAQGRIRDIDIEFDTRVVQQILMCRLIDNDREQSVLQRVVAKYVGNFRADNGAQPKIEQGPRRVFAR